MRYSSILIAALAAGSVTAQETVLGVYIFSRHGDRTAKATPPTNLTDLGYEQVFTSGTYFRNRYISSGASQKIHGMNSDLVKQSQITASAPVDTVLQNSAVGFLQGLYPPVGPVLGSQMLRNGTTVQSPLNGYQLIPLETVQTGANSEDSAWLQGSTDCANAQISSNNFFTSDLYMRLLNSTQSLYDYTKPMITPTFTGKQVSFMNAYTIWDLLNVANIHNGTDDFPSANLLTPSVFQQLFVLGNIHEYNLARAFVLMRMGREADALAAYDAALARKPDLFVALYGRGLVEARLGRAAESRRDTALALASQPYLRQKFERLGVN